ncbi:hypothetical protein HY357_02350, partial [Candidatus Roizmanbacteria bacterium]|nr:hypothetical protein [Candidatus Roizmanbacteria bacterium]
VSFLFLFTSYIPNLYEASVVDIMPSDRVMLWGEHIYTYDYNIYLSKMKQGAEGRWSVVDKYDNNPKQKGVFLQMLYLLAGKAGGLINLSLPLTFHLLRTVLSFAWVLTIIYLNVFFLKKPKYYIPGVLLSLLAASFPVFYKYQNEWWVGYHMSWWTEMDVLKRISYIPHYTLNYIIVALLAISITKLKVENGKLKVKKFSILNSQFLIVCIVLLFSFFIHPSAGILFFFSWFLYHLLKTIWFRDYDRDQLVKIVIYTAVLIITALVPLLYIRSITSTYPWKSLVDFDRYNRFPLDVKEYILALGPIFFTGVLGIILALIRKEKKLLSLVTWVLGAFTAIYVFKKFPYQSELRFVQTANHVPLAIFSVYLFQNIVTRFRNKLVLLVLLIIFVGIILLGVTQSYFSIRAQTDFIHQRAVAGQPLVPYPPQVMYPLKDYWQAMEWLEKNSKNEDVVISQVNAGNYIPAHTGNFVYVGHNPETPHYSERINLVDRFFSGTMSEKDAYDFLRKENISYVFYGPQEKEKSVEDIKKYTFLKHVFASSYVLLYKVEVK